MSDEALKRYAADGAGFISAILREPERAHERRIRLSRLLTIGGLALAINETAWVAGFLFLGNGFGAGIRAVFLALALSVVGFARRGHVRWAAHVLLWLCLTATWSVILVFEGHTALGRSAHIWFIAILVGVYFVLLDASGWTRGFYALLCIGSFLVVALASPSIPAYFAVPEAVVRWAFPITLCAGLVTTAWVLQLFVTNLVDTEASLDRANARLEDLLENMLPRSIALRLRREGRTFADGHDQCSILFADIVGFTTLSERISPDAVVTLLNGVFSRFDDLADLHGLEKIKTIGDAYMIASGIPERREDHASALAEFALDARNAVRAFEGIHLRIGINSGPVVAGVIGRKRFLYDLWGDAVNVAQRMEQYGVPDQIQVTRTTRDLLTEKFEFEPRGEIAMRGHHKVEAFLLLGRRAPAATAA